jgi:hypothetical protein
MDGEDSDLAIIDATDRYNGTKSVPKPANSNGAHKPSPVDDAERASRDAQIAHLESELEAWQRRTVIWRERALAAQALNEALNKHLDDLRVVLQHLPAPTPGPVEGGEPASSATQVEHAAPATRPTATATIAEWCNRVWRGFSNGVR